MSDPLPPTKGVQGHTCVIMCVCVCVCVCVRAYAYVCARPHGGGPYLYFTSFKSSDVIP